MKLFNPRYQEATPFSNAAHDREQKRQATERRSLLMFASHLLHPDQRHPDAVLANAEFLQSWLDEADDDNDRRARMDALNRADMNLRAPHDDPPLTFLEEAKRYYEFLASRQRTGR